MDVIKEPVKTPLHLAQPLDQAAEWILRAAQVRSANPEHDGGFISWYDTETQTPAYVYSEISGYMLTLLASLWERTGDERFRESAIRCGEWFLRTVHEPTGGYRCLFPLSPNRFAFKQDLIYTFDGGVILSGLVNLYRITERPAFLAAAVTLGDWLIGPMQKPSGAFLPLLDLRDGSTPENEHEWSLCSGSYHTKIAIGLTNLYDITRAEKYKRAALAACEYALSFQQPDGRFVSFPNEGGTNVHPHCYSAEGLWVVGSYFERQEYLEASARATAWVWSQQAEDGLVPRHYHNNGPLYSERVDILCQALRLALIHRAEGRLPASIDAQIARLIPIIQRNQAQSSDPQADGAFYFGRQSDGSLTPHANCWVTQFALQALLLEQEYRAGRFDFAPFEMV
ncbi:MAG: hypothetical protein Fur005_12090 [Roseiflexaceae bacterium]